MRNRAAFSLGETLAIVLLIGTFAAVVAPQFAGATEDERTADAQIVIGGVRDAINVYADRARQRGAAPYPSVAELATPGVVTVNRLPANPFTGVRGVQAVSRTQAQSRAVFNSRNAGWNYYFDNNEEIVIFYPNCQTATTEPHPDRGTRTANEL